jgi:type I restriction enzyme, S subunit
MSNWPDFEVPNSWRVIETREIASLMRSGGTPSRKVESYWGGDIPFVLIEDMTSAGLYLEDTKERITRAGLDASSAWIVPPGAVLLSMYATIGATAINRIPLATNQAILAIIPKQDVSAEFLAFCLRAHKSALSARNVQATQKNINKGIVETFPLPIPPRSEQNLIAEILGTVQRAIEQQERLLVLTAEQKNVVQHQIVTAGLHREPQKQTDIGPVPESWEVVPLGNVMSENPKNGLYKHSSAYGSGTPILRINDFSNDGDVVISASNRVETDASENKLYALGKDDIVTNRVNSLSHLGKTALIGELTEPMVFESNMMRFRVDERRALPRYVFRLLNSPLCKRQIVGNAKRAVAQSSINQGNLMATLLPLPSVEIQKEIIEIWETVVTKINVHERKKDCLNELSRTLLHQLMTARVRVHELDLPKLESSVAA